MHNFIGNFILFRKSNQKLYRTLINRTILLNTEQIICNNTLTSRRHIMYYTVSCSFNTMHTCDLQCIINILLIINIKHTYPYMELVVRKQICICLKNRYFMCNDYVVLYSFSL